MFDTNEFFENQISDFKEHIKNYRTNLNNEGVWLFLACLGCWGIPNEDMRNASFIITLILFFYRGYLLSDDKRPFKKIYSGIKEEIESSELPNDIKKARLYELEKIKIKELSYLKMFKSNLIFLICYIFTIVSMEISKSS